MTCGSDQAQGLIGVEASRDSEVGVISNGA